MDKNAGKVTGLSSAIPQMAEKSLRQWIRHQSFTMMMSSQVFVSEDSSLGSLRLDERV